MDDGSSPRRDSQLQSLFIFLFQAIRITLLQAKKSNSLRVTGTQKMVKFHGHGDEVIWLLFTGGP